MGPGMFWTQLRFILFGKGSNGFLVAVIGALPFFIHAVWSFFWLDRTLRRRPDAYARVFTACVTTTAILLGASVWGNRAIVTARGSTASVGFLFLPIELLALLPIGYLAGLGLYSFFGRKVSNRDQK